MRAIFLYLNGIKREAMDIVTSLMSSHFIQGISVCLPLCQAKQPIQDAVHEAERGSHQAKRSKRDATKAATLTNGLEVFAIGACSPGRDRGLLARAWRLTLGARTSSARQVAKLFRRHASLSSSRGNIQVGRRRPGPRRQRNLSNVVAVARSISLDWILVARDQFAGQYLWQGARYLLPCSDSKMV